MIMGADITLKQTFDGQTNDLEFNRIKGSLNEVYMHARTIGKRHLHGLPGIDVNESHYFGRIDIPSTVRDNNGNVYKVTALGSPDKSVMYMATKLERISIPGTVKTIDSYSFAGCIRLASVGLAEGIEEIQENAFWFCKLLRLYLPDSVRSINKAFSNCSILEHIEIGTGMREMKGAFMKCPSIRTVICNAQNPPEINEKTFDADIYMHADLFVPYPLVEKYTNHPLWGQFKNIHEIADTVPSDVQHNRATHPMKDGIRYFLDLSNAEAWVCPLEGSEIYRQKEVVIPDKFENNFPVVRIDDNAFDQSEVTSIKLPSGLKSIGTYAFCNSGLTSISLPASLTLIDGSAFEGCPLKEIDIPGSVTTIGDNAFSCGKLERITLHTGLRKIGAGAGAFTETLALGELTLPSTVTEIGLNAFAGAELKNVTCMALTPPKIEKNQAFDEQVMQNAVLRVPSSALAAYQADPAWGKFRQIFGMGSDQSSTSVASTGDTFVVNYIRYEIIDPNAKVVHVARIRENFKDWFEHCENDYGVADLVIPSSVNYQGQEYVVQGINDEAIMDEGHSIGVLEIPGTVKTIGRKAFYGCANIKSLILHDGLETLEESCFETERANKSIQLTLPNTLKKIGRRAFFNCFITGEVQIPDSVTSIGESAFEQTHISTLTLGRGMTTIEDRVFDDIELKELFIPDWITSIGDFAFNEEREEFLEKITCMAMTPPAIEMNTFYKDNYDRVELRVPASVVNDYRDDLVWGKFANIVGIGDAEPAPSKPVGTGDCFNVKGIRYLVRDADARVVYVTYPDHGRKYVGTCHIPATVEYRGVTYWVKKVGEGAFKGCDQLGSVILPSTIDEIMADAFNVESMGNITCYATTPPSVAKNGLPQEKERKKKMVLIVPETSLDLYKADPNWKGFGTYFTEEMPESSIPEGMPEPPRLVDTGDNIEVDGIRYWIKDASARVAYVTNFPKDNKYTGKVVVPSTVEKDGVTYQVKKVGNYTFMNAASLEAVTLPASIEDVKTKSFEGCTALNSITSLAVTPPLLAADAIPVDVARHVTLFVPKEAIDKYAEAPGWKEFKVRGGMLPI